MNISKKFICALAISFLALASTVSYRRDAIAQSSQSNPQGSLAQKQAQISSAARSTGPADIARAQAQLNVLIRRLQQDPHEYEGHRDKAVQLLNQAQQELTAAAVAAQNSSN